MSHLSPRTAFLSAAQLAEFERVVACFEQDWFAGKRPPIERFLPDDRELRPVFLGELVRIDVEFRQKAGEATRAEEYLAQFPELAADESLMLSLAATGSHTAGRPAQTPEGQTGQSDGDVLSTPCSGPLGLPPASDEGTTAGLETIHEAGQPGSPQATAEQEIRQAGEHDPGDSRAVGRSRQAGKPDLLPFDKLLISRRLLTEKQLKECLHAVGEAVKTTVGQLMAELLRRAWVTSWQLEQLKLGRTAFFLDQDRYLLLSQIGQGGMGAVYKARHTRMNREVALKVIDPRRVTDQSLIRRFRREVEVCSKLQHEHIVQAFDCGVHEGATFLVLEFVEGLDLASLVKRDGPMPPGEAAAICLQAAAGLAYAHAQGVVHRDIKPQNILLSTGGVVKILDMGLARVMEEAGDDPHTSLTQEGAVMGTVDYMPPEQARDTKSADARSDIYSLGGTLYYLLAGRPPFAGGSLIEKMQRLANETPAPIGESRIDCPRALQEIVQKMLAKRPEDRFQTAGEVVRALKPLAAERIAGRAAFTAAVQSAAETIPAAQVIPTDAELLFTQMNESLATSVRQRQAPKASLTPKQKLTLGVVVAALVVIVAGIGWSLTGPSKKSSPPGGNGPSLPPPLAATTEKPENIHRVLPFHYGGVLRLAWSPDGKLLATGGGDGEVRVHDPRTRKVLTVYRGHHAGIHDLVWSRDGEWMVSGDYLGAIHVWEARTGQAKAGIVKRAAHPRGDANVFDYIGGVAIAPDKSEIAYEENGTIVRRHLKKKEPVWKSAGGGAWLDYSPSGKLLASSSGPFVWETETESGDPVYGMPIETPGAAGPGNIVGFLEDDTFVVATSDSMRLWDCRANKLVRELPYPEPPFLFGSSVPFVAIAPSGDRCRMLTLTEAFDLSLADGKVIVQSPLKTSFQAVPPDSRMIGGILHWDTSFHDGRVAYSDGRAVYLTAGETGEVSGFLTDPLLQDAENNFHIHGFFALNGLRFLHQQNGAWDMVRGENDSDLPWSGRVVGGKFLRTFEAPPGGIARLVMKPLSEDEEDEPPPPVALEGFAEDPLDWLRFTEDGRTIWGWPHGKPGRRFWDAETGKLRWECACPPMGNEGFLISGNGDVVAMKTGPWNVIVWRRNANPEVHESVWESSADLWRAGIAPDGSRIAIGPAPNDGPAEVTVWDARNGRKVAAIATGLPRELDPYVVRFSSFASGRYLLVTRKIWDLESKPPKLVWECPENDHAVNMTSGRRFRTGEFFPDERHVLVAQDAQFQIWDWRENRKLATMFQIARDEAVFVNHLTGHFAGGTATFRAPNGKIERTVGHEYLHADFPKNGRIVDINLREYEQATNWKNDPKKAVLDLEKRNREREGKVEAK